MLRESKMQKSLKISVIVKPNAKKVSVEKIDDQTYRISVKSPPTEGKANEAVIKAIAEHFSVAPSSVQIVRGFKGKRKIVKVLL